MNGLTEANVEHLTESINRSIGIYKASGRKEAVEALLGLLYAIEEMRQYNTTHPNRPDRVGDECWYGTWVTAKGWQWRRGILRAWVPGDCPAVVEDIEAKKVECYSMISFSTEAPT